MENLIKKIKGKFNMMRIGNNKYWKFFTNIIEINLFYKIDRAHYQNFFSF